MAAWQQEAAAITSPEVKAATQTRQAEVKSTLGELSAAGKKAGDAYQPFIGDMKDIRTYLSNDLTQAGVKRLDRTIQKARQADAGLQKALDDQPGEPARSNGASAGPVAVRHHSQAKLKSEIR